MEYSTCHATGHTCDFRVFSSRSIFQFLRTPSLSAPGLSFARCSPWQLLLSRWMTHTPHLQNVWFRNWQQVDTELTYRNNKKTAQLKPQYWSRQFSFYTQLWNSNIFNCVNSWFKFVLKCGSFCSAKIGTRGWELCGVSAAPPGGGQES